MFVFTTTIGRHGASNAAVSSSSVMADGRLISEPDSQPARAVDLTGGRRVREWIAQEMRLDDHPMTRKVREYVEGGYRIRLSKGPNVRKPYRQILMYRGDDHRTVQIDGSVKDSWD